MTFERVINMVVNVVLRRVINAGISKGMGLWSRRGKASGPVVPPEARHHDAARANVRRARQAAKITRRLGR